MSLLLQDKGNANLSSKLKRVLLYSDPSKKNSADCAELVLKILHSLGVECHHYLDDSPSKQRLTEFILQNCNFTETGEQGPLASFFDLVITLGGDGTFLKYVSSYSPFPFTPILPINTGSLGFISSLDPTRLQEGLEQLLTQHYVLSKRIALSVQNRDKSYLGVNECCIGSENLGHMAELSLEIDGSSFSIQGDGVILASPTGSTAYSLAAGGPIVHAEMAALVVCPINPFALVTRPMVIPSSSKIIVRIPERNQANIALAIDGVVHKVLQKNDCITITQASQPLTLIASSHKSNYFEHLRSKLGGRSQGKP